MTISGWIKGLIRSAYEKVGNDDMPHLTHTNFQAREFRAMATSLAFHQPQPLGKLCRQLPGGQTPRLRLSTSGTCLRLSLSPPWVR
jgi:hypothetical protein